MCVCVLPCPPLGGTHSLRLVGHVKDILSLPQTPCRLANIKLHVQIFSIFVWFHALKQNFYLLPVKTNDSMGVEGGTLQLLLLYYMKVFGGRSPTHPPIHPHISFNFHVALKVSCKYLWHMYKWNICDEGRNWAMFANEGVRFAFKWLIGLRFCGDNPRFPTIWTGDVAWIRNAQ